MNLRPALPLAALALLAACMSQEPEQVAPISTMSAPEIVAPEGRYLWACSVAGADAGMPWHFAIVEQENETGSEILLETAGVNAAYPLNRQEAGGFETYRVGASGDRVEIAPGGAARLFWGGASDANYTGTCLKGEPA